MPLTLGGQTLNVNGGNGVTFGDEIGFLLEIFKNADGTYYYNMNPNDAGAAPSWLDVRLGVAKKFMTFYATNISEDA